MFKGCRRKGTYKDRIGGLDRKLFGFDVGAIVRDRPIKAPFVERVSSQKPREVMFRNPSLGQGQFGECATRETPSGTVEYPNVVFRNHW